MGPNSKCNSKLTHAFQGDGLRRSSPLPYCLKHARRHSMRLRRRADTVLVFRLRPTLGRGGKTKPPTAVAFLKGEGIGKCAPNGSINAARHAHADYT